jgi:cysteine desulfurase
MTQDYYNPAAAYGAAFGVEKQVNEARAFAASLVGAKPEEILYTSGGTESNNMSVFGSLRPMRNLKSIVTTETEHPSVYETIRTAAKEFGMEIVYAPLKADGTVDLDRLSDVLHADTGLVSIMHVNNELGSVNDLDAIARKVRALSPNAVLHADGVQAFMKVPTGKLPVDLYSVSAHKLHAPKGVGFLLVRNGIRFAGGQIGGGQERNLRSGTTNVPGILGMDSALRLYQANQRVWHQQMFQVKKRLYENLGTLGDVCLNGPAIEEGAPHILNLSFLGVRGEVLLHALERYGVIVSTGSACAAKKQGKNRVLNAIGIGGARQEGAIRFSFCPFNTVAEADEAANVIADQVRMLRKYKRR